MFMVLSASQATSRVHPVHMMKSTSYICTNCYFSTTITFGFYLAIILELLLVRAVLRSQLILQLQS